MTKDTNRDECWRKWKEVIDSSAGPGMVERNRGAFLMANMYEEKPFDAINAVDFLKDKPEFLLRAVINSSAADFITNAGEFTKKFQMITANSNSISIYDRYLLKCTSKLLLEGEIPGYNENFDKLTGDLVPIVRSLNLILHSISENVQKISIFSEMARWSDFRDKMVRFRLNQYKKRDG